MEFADVVRARRMVRRYRDEPVDPAALERIIDRALRAPSAGNTQGQSFVVITDADVRESIAEAAREPAYVAKGFEPWVSRAPVHIVVCVREDSYRERYAEPDKTSSLAGRWDVPFWWVDGGAAMMLVLLAAVDEGLAAGFLAVEHERLRGVLGIPADVTPLGLITIGHPAPDRRSRSLDRPRRPRDQLVRKNRWS